MKEIKTNTMRMIEKAKIDYEIKTYDTSDGHIDGLAVAKKTNEDPSKVFKTLVTKGMASEYYVFAIPVMDELDLKKAAKIVKEKRVEMIPVNDLLKVTGFVRGGCSPINPKKRFKTVIHRSGEDLDEIIVSGGKIGVQVILKPSDLIKLVDGSFGDIVK